MSAGRTGPNSMADSSHPLPVNLVLVSLQPVGHEAVRVGPVVVRGRVGQVMQGGQGPRRVRLSVHGGGGSCSIHGSIRSQLFILGGEGDENLMVLVRFSCFLYDARALLTL